MECQSGRFHQADLLGLISFTVGLSTQPSIKPGLMYFGEKKLLSLCM